MSQRLEAQEVQGNTISIQAERMNLNIEHLFHLNDILESSLERIAGPRPRTDTTEKQGKGASDTEGVLEYITYKNSVIEEQLSKAHCLLGEITSLI